MKRLFTLMLLVAAVCVNALALSETAIVLHHGSEVKIYDGPSHLQEALNDATDGDTLYLGAGSYDGFTIDKRIFVRGAGNLQTQINGNISIYIDDEEDVEYTEPILEGLYIYSGYNLYFYGYTTKGLTIRKCSIPYVSVQSGTHKDVTFDRCHITSCFYYQNDFDGLSIVNSQLGQFCSYNATRDDVTIYNSNIYQFYNPSYFCGSIYNSIINYYYNSSTFYSMKMVNTLLYSSIGLASSVTYENIYYTSEWWLSSDGSYLLPLENLREYGYLGTDGTVVGAAGGSTPFTLTLSTPQVESAALTVDNAKKVLNVNIKLTGTKTE